MAKFNAREKAPMDTSYEGAKEYVKDVEDAWFNFMFSSYLEPGFYEDDMVQRERFQKLTDKMIKKHGAELVAKTAIFARDNLGLRSISHLTAAILNAEKFADKRAFYRNICKRPDDMAEIFAAIDSIAGKRSHAAVRGFGDYLPTISKYQLAKYKMNGRDYNIADLINICHPKPSAAIQAFKNGTLEVADTWETSISATKGDEQKKAKEWQRLVEDNKLGYLALLRNIRNILETDPSRDWIKQYLIPAIANKQAIQKSRIYPYQIYSVYKALSHGYAKIVMGALEDAFYFACANLEPMRGKTCVMLDVSGSMDDRISRNSDITIKECGAVFAAMYILAGNDVEFIKFGSDAKSMRIPSFISAFDLIEKLYANDNLGYGTDVQAAFRCATRDYDRILLISDQQCMDENSGWGWFGGRSDGLHIYEDYCREHGNTHIYSFDLGNYKTQVANPRNSYVHLCTTLNDKVFELMPYIENSGNLIDYINQNVSYR